MRTHTWIGVFALIWILTGTGYDGQSAEIPAAGALPAVKAPVGPIPGPGTQAALPRNPLAGNPMALTEGRKLFVSFNCAGCHGDHGGGGMGPSLRDKTWIYGGSEAHIFDSIAQGRAHGMPAWGTKVPEEQIWQLVAYIQSLRTPREPQPPQ
jgi:cytochrome c oxidase cbb3-type subunit 3